MKRKHTHLATREGVRVRVKRKSLLKRGYY